MADLNDNMYGISRNDDPVHRVHAWRVSLRRRGKMLVKNFSDKRCGGQDKALLSAKQYRDEVLREHPPLTRKEFSCAPRKNNRTGITGVYKYAKPYRLKNGTKKETWYWEANWPTEVGVSAHQAFSIKRFGDEFARQMAIKAREKGIAALTGAFWASERGLAFAETLADSRCKNTVEDKTSQTTRVA